MDRYPSSLLNSLMVWIGSVDDTPLGVIWAAVSAEGVVALNLWHDRARFEAQVLRLTQTEPTYAPDRVTAVFTQLHEYFNRERKVFDLPIHWAVMSQFQQTALRAVYAVPYGRYVTYADIAREIGKETAVRAVGRANGANPIPIIIPCHRVLGSNGKLHGYSAPGGLETKAFLLRLEGSWLL